MLSLAVAALAASGSFAAARIRPPYVQNVGTDGATIMWTAREHGSAIVRYSVDGDLSRSVVAQVRELPRPAGGGALFVYRADLRGLLASRSYLYQVVVDGAALTEPLRFRTSGPGPFTFLAFGDSGTGNEQQAAVARRMIDKENPSLVLHTGDLSQESGTIDQLDANYLAVYGPLMARAPFFPTPGNHDYYTDQGTPCFSLHSPPALGVPAEDRGRYYSFDWGNVHFVSLNSNLLEYPAAAARMLEWLDRDLQQQKAFWKIVYFHHLPYPTGHHRNDLISAAVREKVVPIVERHNVQLVLSGHEHSFQRTVPLKNGSPAADGRGTVYIVTGGGGGMLHDINSTPLHAVVRSAHHYLRGEIRGAALTITAVGMDGDILDRHTIVADSQPVTEAIVNAATFTTAMAHGSLISIFGRHMAVEERTARTPLPAEIAGTSVTLNGERLPLLFVSPYQINAQLPYGVSGRGRIRVATRTSSAEMDVDVTEIAPAILQVPDGRGEVPAVFRSESGGLAGPDIPLHGGELVSAFAIGLGQLEADVRAGDTAPASPPLRTLHRVELLIGGRAVQSVFAGLWPGVVGVYQITFRVPDDIPDGANALRVVVNGVASDPVTVFAGRPFPSVAAQSRSRE